MGFAKTCQGPSRFFLHRQPCQKVRTAAPRLCRRTCCQHRECMTDEVASPVNENLNKFLSGIKG